MDLQKICRICLKSDLLVSIFSPTFLMRPIEMIEKLNIFEIDDNLTKFLCQSCLYHIIHIWKELSQLQQMAQASERQMREYLRCNSNYKLDTTTPAAALQVLEQNKVTTLVANFCDIFQTSAAPQSGVDDMLNDVEIDVSSLTRSEPDDTLSEVFVDAQMSSHFETEPRNLTESVGIVNSTSFESALTATSKPKIMQTQSDRLVRPKGGRTKSTEKCAECNKIFKTSGYLLHHQRNHTGEKPFKCKLCYRQFRHQSNLRLHEQVHNRQQRRFQCEICASFFTTSSNLKAHRLTHSNERDFECDKCLKCFKSERELRRHKPIHDVDKAHKCDECNKSFHKSCYLNAHILTVHQNQRKYKCSDCNKLFATSSNLKSHMRIHAGEKPFQCEHCTWKFSQSSALMRHIQRKHPSILKSKNLEPTTKLTRPLLV